MSGPKDNRPPAGPPPAMVLTPVVITPEMQAAIDAAPMPSPDQIAQVAALLGPHLTAATRELATR